jgi:PAS domain S-box-containing protein
MKKPLDIEKFDWTNVTDDFKKMQQISGIGAAAAIVISLYMLLTTPLPKSNLLSLWLTIVVATAFVAVYYTIPKLYLNRSLIFLPDLAFIAAITSAMINFGDKGDMYIVFLIFLISVNAFMYPTGTYLTSVFGSIAALFLVHLIGMGNFIAAITHQALIFEVYGVLSVGIILRIFATETISLRKKEESLKEKTRELSDQRRELFLLIDNISDGIIAVDRDKKISLINKTAMKVLGMIGGTKMMVGKNADKILNTVSTNGHFSVFDEVIEKRQSVMRSDLRLVRHDKTLKLHTNTAPVIDNEGNVNGAIVLFRDITSEKNVEEQRAEFNAIASHELRTPLTVIEGYLYYLLTDSSLKYDKKTKEFIEKSHEASNQLLHLTNDILTVIKSDENELKVALEEVDIKKLAKTCVDEFTSKAKTAKIKLLVEADSDLPKIISDEGKVKEVISNLIENAIKFTEKGKVTVAVSSPKETEVLVEVTDTGIGISKEDQKMIFHKFFRTEDWQTRKRGGTGLGLYISKSFIERLGGKIGERSEKGKGSTFWFSLPTKVGLKKKKSNNEELNEFIKSL